MADQVQDQLRKFLQRGRNRRKQPGGYQPVKQGQVAPFKPRKQSAKRVAKY